MAGLIVLPELRDGSLGRAKSDRFQRWDLSTQVSAGEHNVLRTAVYELAQAIGLADGSVSGTLVAILLRGLAPQGVAPSYLAPAWYQGQIPSFVDSNLGSFADIEEWTRVNASRWLLTQVASGSYGISSGSTEPNAIGSLRLIATGSGDGIHLVDSKTWFVAGHWPVLRARVKVPADLADATLQVGFGDHVTGSHQYAALLSPQPAGWDCITYDAGSPTTAADQGTAPTPDGWHDTRIEVEHSAETLQGEVRFYVDGVLIYTATSPYAPAQAMGCYASVAYVANSGGEGRLDYFDLRMNRIAAS